MPGYTLSSLRDSVPFLAAIFEPPPSLASTAAGGVSDSPGVYQSFLPAENPYWSAPLLTQAEFDAATWLGKYLEMRRALWQTFPTTERVLAILNTDALTGGGQAFQQFDTRPFIPPDPPFDPHSLPANAAMTAFLFEWYQYPERMLVANIAAIAEPWARDAVVEWHDAFSNWIPTADFGNLAFYGESYFTAPLLGPDVGPKIEITSIPVPQGVLSEPGFFASFAPVVGAFAPVITPLLGEALGSVVSFFTEGGLPMADLLPDIVEEALPEITEFSFEEFPDTFIGELPDLVEPLPPDLAPEFEPLDFSDIEIPEPPPPDAPKSASDLWQFKVLKALAQVGGKLAQTAITTGKIQPLDLIPALAKALPGLIGLDLPKLFTNPQIQRGLSQVIRSLPRSPLQQALLGLLPALIGTAGSFGTSLAGIKLGVDEGVDKLASADVAGSILAADVTALHLDSLLPTLEEWIRILEEGQALPDERAQEFFDTRVSPFLNALPGSAESNVALGAAVVGLADKTIKVVTTEGLSAALSSGTDVVMGKVVTWFAVVLQFMVGHTQEVAGKLEPLFKIVLDFYREQIRAIGPVSPESGFDTAANFLTQATGFGMSAHLVAVLVEMLPHTKHFGLPQLAAFLADVGAFGAIANNTWGRAIGHGVGQPAEYEINYFLRPKIPDERELLDAMIERKYAPEEVLHYLAYHGYSDYHADKLVRTAWRDPRLREIVLLASDVSVREEDVEDWLREAGYEDKDVVRMAPIVMQQSVKAQRAQLLAEVFTSLKTGVMSRDEAGGHMERLQIPLAGREYLLDAAALAERRELIATHLKELETLAKAAIISTLEYAEAAEALGVSREHALSDAARIQATIDAKITTKRAAEIERETRQAETLSIAALKEQFGLGLFDRHAFESLLVLAGVSEIVAAEIVALEVVRQQAKGAHGAAAESKRLAAEEQSAAVALQLEAFRKGLTTVEELDAQLVAAGVAPSVAADMAAREILRATPVPKREVPLPKA